MVPPEGGDLNDLPAKTHVHNTETAPDDARVAKQRVHFFWGGVGGDIEIFRMPAQQQVSDRAADKIGLVVMASQARHHFERAVADVFAGDVVFVPGDDLQASQAL